MPTRGQRARMLPMRGHRGLSRFPAGPAMAPKPQAHNEASHPTVPNPTSANSQENTGGNDQWSVLDSLTLLASDTLDR